jgi:hypothetical protein
VLGAAPFAGEGDRTVRARLGREHGIQVSGTRSCGCSDVRDCWHRSGPAGAANHDRMTAAIIPPAPNQRWGTDATMAWTRVDGWVWGFACVDHDTAEAWGARGQAR